MTRNEINIALASVLETLDEMPDGAAPEGILALAVEAGMPAAAGRWNDIAALLMQAELCESFSHLMTITDRGRAVAKTIRACRTAVRS